MSGVCLDVPGRSNASLMDLAQSVRQSLRWEKPYFPIAQFMELGLPTLWPDYEFQVVERQMMPSEHGLTYPDKRLVLIREDVYEGALRGAGRDRFTMAHELGHLLLHTNVGMARHVQKGTIPAYRDSEWQANAFAGALLIPRFAVNDGPTIDQIMERCGVSRDAAEVQMKKYRT
ncbi:ImmA/IrrE family metallo-endopeptidase [Dyella acidisoli]|uniref:IrrE N-terminal-like domain-containing protein n=1 Tax=Dyella acidisoli TaxID=1867834 RepID=A0ABQ5XSQ2_9GAMM|nr:ImmA/IrrE family metallo-endopeptidase [Dyella acidisoli]GLQ93478.1 hypothetical protein GCM10007901_24290 [Dyella acidisoli]